MAASPHAAAHHGIALLSGGLDSGVAAAMFAASPGHALTACLFFDYGQRAARREAVAATRLAERLGVPLRQLELPWLGDLARQAGSRLMAGTGDLPQGSEQVPGDERSAAAVWVPARNVVFVAIAAAHAEAAQAQFVVTGFNREEAVTFADNSAAFVRRSDAMLALGTRNGVRVTSPTIGMDKAEIVAAARARGFTASDFWSCYDGGETPCGRCESCLRSRWSR